MSDEPNQQWREWANATCLIPANSRWCQARRPWEEDLEILRADVADQTSPFHEEAKRVYAAYLAYCITGEIQ